MSMPLIVTPRQLSRQSDLYHQIASLLAAGVGLVPALEMLHRNPPARTWREPLSRLVRELTQGSTFTEALQRQNRWLPSFDIALISAGEQSGRLDAVCRLLAAYYRERAVLARSVLSNLAYPVFVLHIAVLIFPTAMIYQMIWLGNLAGYLWQKALILVPLYVLLWFGVYASQGRHGERWRSWLETLLHPVPLLGAARRQLALARLAAALEALINAGVPLVEAWDLAAAASGSPALSRAVAAWRPRVLAGETPAEAIGKSGAFPELFANLYHTGEVSGQLDDSLRRLHALYQEEGSNKLQLVAAWTPRLVYFAVMLLVAYQVVQFWLGYFNQLNQVMQ
ncbi:MAG: type II secretion system F family protein [Verrucomicrobia bacterium]|nr:type II secretion system F family protein [Verrucomicrobiota bacterium]